MTGILNILAGSISSAIKDGYFNLVSLLLSGDGTNGANNNTFIDSSTNNFTITRNGNTTQGTFSPFSQTGWGNYFDGSSYLTAPSGASVSGNSAFTVDFWVFMPVANTGARIVSGAANQLTINMSSDGSMAYGKNGVTDVITVAAGTSILGQWTHIAIGKSGANGTARIWRNGTSVGTATDSQTYTSGTVYVGATSVPSLYLNGYISNLRITNTDVYGTSNTTITVPTSPLTAVTGTQLLTCQSNRFIDNSSNAFAITVNGTPSVQAFSPFAPTAAYSAATNGGSGYFDGSGDYLTTPSTSVFNYGTGAFTVEMWLYPTSSFSGDMLFFGGLGTGSTNAFGVGSTNSGTQWGLLLSRVGWQLLTTTMPKINQWNHIVVARGGSSTNQCSLFLNGTRVANGTVSSNFSYTGAYSCAYDGSNQYFPGYISNLRVVGSDVYGYTNTSITVPTAPVTAITSTSILFSFTNAGITDATAKNVLETVGNAQISTTQSKFGGSSMYFDGTGDRLYIPDGKGYVNGTEPFTLECWVYLGGTPNYWTIFGSSSGSGLLFTVQNLTTVIVNPSGAGNTLSGTTSLTAGTWFHLALTRNSSNRFDIWVNGVSVGNATSSQSFGTPTHFVIGAADNSGGQQFNGYLDDVRISKFCRYTTTFTPPTAAFPLS